MRPVTTITYPLLVVVVVVVVGCSNERKSSTSGWSFCRTLSSSLRICVIVVSSVRRSGAGFEDELWSPPPMIAMVDFSLMPYADTAQI